MYTVMVTIITMMVEIAGPTTCCAATSPVNGGGNPLPVLIPPPRVGEVRP
jgi:hypothetical protein